MLDISKFLSISLFSLYATAAFGYGTPVEQLEGADASVSGITVKNVEGSVGGKNPAQPAQKDRIGLFFEGDFLYWKGTQDGLLYATSSDSFTSGMQNITEGREHRMHGEYDPGFRLLAGYRCHRDAWEFLVKWTDFRSSHHQSVDAEAGGYVLPVWSPVSVGEFASSASARWKLGYYVFDAELGRNYFVSKALTIRPFFGLRGAWINQKLFANYDNVGVGAIRSSSVEAEMKNNYHAGGLRTGFNLEWFFGRTIGIYGFMSGSLVYGRYDVKTEVEVSEVELVDIDADMSRMRGNLEAGLGLKWAFDFNHGKERFSLSLGYEMIQWWNMNQMLKVEFPGTASGFVHRTNGDLGLQGMTLAAGLEF